MSSPILPVLRSLYLCDFHVGYEDGRVDLYGLFNALRPAAYPFTRDRFTVYAQLTGGVGEVPVYIDIRSAAGDRVHTTRTMRVRFPTRLTLIQLAVTVEGCEFAEPGLYTVDLYCHDTWVADTTLRLPLSRS